MPVTCEERWAAHTACARAALPSSAAAAPSAPTSELEEAGVAVPRPVLLAEAFALPFGAAAGAFLAAGAGAVGWAAGLPKSVSWGMGLDHEGDGDSDGDGGDGDGGDGGDGDGGDGDGGDGGDGDGGDGGGRAVEQTRARRTEAFTGARAGCNVALPTG